MASTNTGATLFTIMVSTPSHPEPKKLGAWHHSVKGVDIATAQAVAEHYFRHWPENNYYIVEV